MLTPPRKISRDNERTRVKKDLERSEKWHKIKREERGKEEKTIKEMSLSRTAKKKAPDEEQMKREDGEH